MLLKLQNQQAQAALFNKVWVIQACNQLQSLVTKQMHHQEYPNRNAYPCASNDHWNTRLAINSDNELISFTLLLRKHNIYCFKLRYCHLLTFFEQLLE